MLFKRKEDAISTVRARVTPDPEQAAELQRRLSALTYHPSNGFHRDRQQRRQDRSMALRPAR